MQHQVASGSSSTSQLKETPSPKNVHLRVESELRQIVQATQGKVLGVTEIYVSGDAKNAPFVFISALLGSKTALIRAADNFMFVLPGLYFQGHLCFESPELRQAIFDFIDQLRACADPEDQSAFDDFIAKFQELIAFFDDIRSGHIIEEHEYSVTVTKSITALTALVSDKICNQFIRRESDIRTGKAISYRRPTRTADESIDLGVLAKLDDIKTSVDSTRTDVRDVKKEVGAILFIDSKGDYGVDPALANLFGINKQTMVQFGFDLIAADEDLSAPQAADLVFEHYPHLVGAYKQKNKEDRENLRQAIVRFCRVKGVRLKTNRKNTS